MKRTADNKEFLPQNFLLMVVDSQFCRRTFLDAVIQRMIVPLTAAGSLFMHLFLKPTGENNDELFGAFEVFRPIRPNRIT